LIIITIKIKIESKKCPSAKETAVATKRIKTRGLLS